MPLLTESNSCPRDSRPHSNLRSYNVCNINLGGWRYDLAILWQGRGNAFKQNFENLSIYIDKIA